MASCAHFRSATSTSTRMVWGSAAQNFRASSRLYYLSPSTRSDRGMRNARAKRSKLRSVILRWPISTPPTKARSTSAWSAKSVWLQPRAARRVRMRRPRILASGGGGGAGFRRVNTPKYSRTLAVQGDNVYVTLAQPARREAWRSPTWQNDCREGSGWLSAVDSPGHEPDAGRGAPDARRVEAAPRSVDQDDR
jgi:hypothetical protein